MAGTFALQGSVVVQHGTTLPAYFSSTIPISEYHVIAETVAASDTVNLVPSFITTMTGLYLEFDGDVTVYFGSTVGNVAVAFTAPGPILLQACSLTALNVHNGGSDPVLLRGFLVGND